MPRMGRLHVDGGCYHVMGRGVEGRSIFATAEDKKDFIIRLSVGLQETEISCLAWALMSNHYHLLLRVHSLPLRALMQGLLGGYATKYNRRHQRIGYVYQNRFKSILCQEENYLLALVRYIHLNPIKAGLLKSVSALDKYEWSGHATLMGKKRNVWQQTDPVLRRFGDTLEVARERYRTFVEEGNSRPDNDYSGGGLVRSYGGWESLSSLRREHTQRVGDERILGDSDFVVHMLQSDEIGFERYTKYQSEGWDLSQIVNIVCAHFNLPSRAITKKGRNNNVAKAKCTIAYLANVECGYKVSEIASQLSITSAAVSKLKRQGYEFCREHNITLARLRR